MGRSRSGNTTLTKLVRCLPCKLAQLSKKHKYSKDSTSVKSSEGHACAVGVVGAHGDAIERKRALG